MSTIRKCFRCSQPADIFITISGEPLHRECAQVIITEYIQETKAREADLSRRYAEKLARESNARILAESLGFTAPAGQQPFIYASEPRETIAVDPAPAFDETLCVRCGTEAGYHSNDTDACPTGEGVFCLAMYPPKNQTRKVGDDNGR